MKVVLFCSEISQIPNNTKSINYIVEQKFSKFFLSSVNDMNDTIFSRPRFYDVILTHPKTTTTSSPPPLPSPLPLTPSFLHHLLLLL